MSSESRGPSHKPRPFKSIRIVSLSSDSVPTEPRKSQVGVKLPSARVGYNVLQAGSESQGSTPTGETRRRYEGVALTPRSSTLTRTRSFSNQTRAPTGPALVLGPGPADPGPTRTRTHRRPRRDPTRV